MRDGEIKSNASIQDGAEGAREERKDQGKSTGADYLKFLIKASRIKPKMIDSISTHKDLLTAMLASMKYPQSYLGE